MVTRRGFVLGLAMQVATLQRAAVATSDVDSYRADEKSIDTWMQAWMANSKEPVGTLHISRFADPMYFLTKQIAWKPNPGQEQLPLVFVSVGFVTDFASIPRIFWSLLRPDGLYTYAAIVHDYLYWFQPCPRDTADQVLSAGMEDFGVDTVTRTAIFQAVHLFGNSAWEENQKLKAKGEQRVLTKVPSDPKITWEQWKKDPAHF
jgi:hypothetical protein